MALFQASVLNYYLKQLDNEKMKNLYAAFSLHFLNIEKQKNIRNLKEESYQEGFIRDLFVTVLGYTLNPQPNFNVELEKKNVNDSRKADAAIINNSSVCAVIELKGTDTINLDAVKNQVFGYKKEHKNCTYLITSNFEKLRFYIDDATEKEDFDLFELTFEDFKRLYLCLAKENIFNNIPLKIKTESISIEEDITKKLYEDYSIFKKLVYKNLVELNPKFDKIVLYKKTQKLLDRFLFIFFAEDRQLIPPNSIREIISQWEILKKLDNYESLYSRFKKFFGYLDKGCEKNGIEIFAYNGGLFAEDDILDNVIIDDELLLKNCTKISNYDYEKGVDVNILGHIFEHSLNEIEEVQSESEGVTLNKTKTKRKKEGVFYTPNYITLFIVENTVGELCEEKKKEIGIIDDEFTYEKRKNRRKELLEKITTYRNWLLKLTICDPACGSGAFLNQTLNFLIKEHQNLDELTSKLMGESLILSDFENSILENNLFGVDLNEESVEIAKLSLWLRTAKKGRKLSTLSSNIKCGNSLVEDSRYAENKAFNWQKEFPEVFKNGGFDIVIGNPPYVRQELFKDIKKYLEINYECFNSIGDLYTYFIEKGLNILNDNGKFSFILPNKFLKASYGKEIRSVIQKKADIKLIYDFDDYPVFEDATTYPIIFFFEKINNEQKYETFTYSKISRKDVTNDPIELLKAKSIICSRDSLNEESWQFQNLENDDLLSKIKKDSILLKDLINDKIFRGVSTGKNEVFIINKEIANNLLNSRTESYIRKIVTGTEVKRYKLTYEDLYLLYIPWEYDLEFDSEIKKYLLSKRDLLESRPEVKEGRFNWWCLSRYGSKNAKYLFEPKIIYPRINKECNFFFDESGEMSLSDNNFFISTNEQYLLPILNSKLVFYFLKSIASSLQGGYLDFRRPYIEAIPIKIPDNKELLIEKSKLIFSKNNELQEIKSKFLKILKSKFSTLIINNKLEDWHNFDFTSFTNEIKKQKIILTLSDSSELIEFFEKEKQKTEIIKKLISTKEDEINFIVYELYNLTPDQIEIIKNTTR